MPDVLHYRGDVTEALLEQSNTGHLFGPDKWGAFYELTGAEFDPAHTWPEGSTGRTTATFTPHVDPRTRQRFHGGDTEPDAPLAPTLHTRDTIRGR